MPTPMGGVKTETVVLCPKCHTHVLVPAQCILRIPGKRGLKYCHETVDPRTGIVYRKGPS